MAEKKIAIVTGASSGIGQYTAIELAKAGYLTVLAARRLEKLQEAAELCRQAGGQAETVVTDVSKQEQVEALVCGTAGRHGRIDVMVNNAGYGLHDTVEDTTDKEMREMFDVNFHGLFYGCKAVIPVMKRQRSGHIFNLSSVAGKRGTPLHGGYSATKFAITGLSDSLRVEMMPHNVKVTTVCPSLTATDFFENVHRRVQTKSRFMDIRKMQSPQVIARSIVRCIGRNKPEIVFTAGGKFLVMLNYFWPRGADYIMKIYLDDLMKSQR